MTSNINFRSSNVITTGETQKASTSGACDTTINNVNENQNSMETNKNNKSVSEIPAENLRAQYLPNNKYSNLKLTKLLDEYMAQLNYNGPNINEIKEEFYRRGLPTMAECPERFFRP